MTTLEAIGFTIAGGSILCAASIGVFGLVNYARHPFVAPRATARPLNVIYAGRRPKHAEQNRGNPWYGWIPWVMSLSYDTLLRGVPGTGTRRNGMQGSMLRVNLDGIVLLRFHALCLRVTALATFLFLVILLPNYLSAQCYRLSAAEAADLPQCASGVYNLTNYEQTTIANIPILRDASLWDTILSPTHSGVLGRLYAVVICFGVVSAYMLYQLYHEWIDVLAMRRVYYLEKDVWSERREELKNTLLYEESNQSQQRKHKHFTFVNQETNGRSTVSSTPTAASAPPRTPIEAHLIDRDPWIPHPEQRDTVPNVALYSVLVGGLPSLPESALSDMEDAMRDSIDWQLSLTSTFFDHCVPNQPGFSSSVAAVTIIPSANDLSRAWRAWYMAAKRLRRLRFIRAQIAERRHFVIDAADDEAGAAPTEGSSPAAPPPPVPGLHSFGGSMNSLRVTSSTTTQGRDNTRGYTGNAHHPRPGRRNSLWSPAVMDEEEEDETTPRDIYDDAAKNQEYYRQVLGSLAENEEESHAYEAMTFGPEQTAVYSREFAQSAGACCPNGCFEGRIRNAPIDDLLVMEQKVAQEVHEANLALKRARKNATTTVRSAGGGSDEESIRKSKSLESMPLPQDMGLESALFQRKSSITGGTPTTEGLLQRQPSMAQRRTSNESTVNFLKEEISNHLHSKPPLKAIHEDPNDPSISSYLSEPGPPITTEHYPDDLEQGGGASLNSHGREGRGQKAQPWEQVQSIVMDMQNSRKDGTRMRSVPSGVWRVPQFRSFFTRTTKQATNLTEWAKFQSTAAIDDISRESTYAVVTFTSRQAAVAARHCMADGRASGRWETDSNIPIPPLADAAAWDLMVCRSCCRPVTLSINERQKNLRNYVATVLLITIYTLYTIPLTLASSLVAPERLGELFPNLADRTDSQAFETAQLVSGMLSALIWTSFFALCPVIFKAIANFGSNATSVAQAEFKALQYFWWFMLSTAFTGQLLAQMLLYGFNDGVQLGSDITSILRNVALAIPSTISASWLNWIIVRFLVILPLNYLLQINTFLFYYLGMPCCARVVRGGGPGAPTPYRIYVDSGVVLMCCLALAPASPLIAPACFLYFLFCQPILRRAAIFVYRPKFDGGGLRFPFIFDMMISALMVAQVLLCTSMALKQALGPAFLAAAPVMPTYLFSKSMKRKFLQAYRDAALMQTSLLDGWNTDEATSMKEREEFRRFLVDAHKAAYVPVCIAGTEEDEFLTAEPAVVVPLETELIEQEFEEMANQPLNHSFQNHEEKSDVTSVDASVSVSNLMAPRVSGRMERRGSQYGATLRRARNTITAMRARHDSSVSNGSDGFSHVIQEENNSVTPGSVSRPPMTPTGSTRSHGSASNNVIGTTASGFDRTSDMLLPSIFYRSRPGLQETPTESANGNNPSTNTDQIDYGYTTSHDIDYGYSKTD